MILFISVTLDKMAAILIFVWLLDFIKRTIPKYPQKCVPILVLNFSPVRNYVSNSFSGCEMYKSDMTLQCIHIDRENTVYT